MALPAWIQTDGKAVVVTRHGYGALGRLSVHHATVKVGKRFVTTASKDRAAHALRFDYSYGNQDRLVSRKAGYDSTSFELVNPDDTEYLAKVEAQAKTQATRDYVRKTARELNLDKRDTVMRLRDACDAFLALPEGSE